MTARVYFIAVYWLLSVPDLAVFILFMYTHLHRTSAIDVLQQNKAVIFGAGVLVIVSLCLVSLTCLGGWCIDNEDETASTVPLCLDGTFDQCSFADHCIYAGLDETCPPASVVA